MQILQARKRTRKRNAVDGVEVVNGMAPVDWVEAVEMEAVETMETMDARTDADLPLLTQPKVLLCLRHILFTMLSSDSAFTPTDNEIEDL